MKIDFTFYPARLCRTPLVCLCKLPGDEHRPGEEMLASKIHSNA